MESDLNTRECPARRKVNPEDSHDKLAPLTDFKFLVKARVQTLATPKKSGIFLHAGFHSNVSERPLYTHESLPSDFCFSLSLGSGGLCKRHAYSTAAQGISSNALRRMDGCQLERGLLPSTSLPPVKDVRRTARGLIVSGGRIQPQLLCCPRTNVSLLICT